jgi:hypothetical protein
LHGAAPASADGTPSSAVDRLYWFDDEQGAFVERGEIVESAGMAQGEIDRLGHWAVGRFDASERTRCQRLRVQDGSGAPLPFAALHVTSSEHFESAALFAGADGSACWEGAATTQLILRAFGASGAGLTSAVTGVTIDPEASATPGACGDDPDTCAQPPVIVAGPLTQTCVRGTVTTNTGGTVQWNATSEAEQASWGGTLEQPGPFCLVVPRSAELQFSSINAHCTAELSSAGDASGICGASDCLDLGTIECCNVYDLCAVPGTDEDCDGTVDEGCVCGAGTCTDYRQDACCTSEQVCGARAVVSRECLQLDQLGRPEPTCPGETIAISGTETYYPTGCCRPDGQCGLTSGWGCIARAQASEIWPIETPLAPMACQY